MAPSEAPLGFAALLDRFRGLQAVVLGDLMLDEYVCGRATRVSPEAPVMVIRHTESRHVPGGAANVAKNIVALGGEVTVLGVAGNDEAGLNLERSLHELPRTEAHVVIDPARPTTQKTRVLAGPGYQVLRIDREENGPVSAAVEHALSEWLMPALERCDVLLLSDYDKGALTPDLASAAIRRCRELGRPVAANPKPRKAQAYGGADLVSLNRSELGAFCGGREPEGFDEAIDMAEAARAQIACGALLVTLGEDGMAFAAGGLSGCAPAPKVEVYDTAGAGDTTIATVALGLAARGLHPEIFSLAAQTAAAVVAHFGVAVPGADDLEAIRAL